MYAPVKKILHMLSLFVIITSCVDDNEIPFQADKARMNSKVYPQNLPDDKIGNAIDFINTVFKKDEKKTNGGAAHQYTQADITNTFEIADAQKKVRLKLLCFQPSGYALISALEDAKPLVLWYSEGTFNVEHINPGLSNYIGEFMEYVTAYPIKEHRTGNDSSECPFTTKTTVLSRYSVTRQKGPFLTTYWNQDPPFNNQCPKIGDKHCVAGCVPIAIGQIINYHRKDNHKNYNWERMKDIYNPETSTFIHDIGVAVYTKYRLGPPDDKKGSSAKDENARDYFVTAGYPRASLIGYSFVTLKNNIDLGYPVYLSGKSDKKGVYFIIRWAWEYYHGHAWVADGYKEVINYEEIERKERYVCLSPEQEYEMEQYHPIGIEHEKKCEVQYMPAVECEFWHIPPGEHIKTSHYTIDKGKTNFIHMNWGWGYGYQGKTDGWCTYDYFKPEDGKEYKYKKRMINFN